MTAHSLTLIPRISEKTYALAQGNTYVFNVPLTTNKQQVADAVAKQYDVAVQDVRIIIAKGKLKRTVRAGGAKTSIGRRNDVKKAYVTLAEGSTIKIFEEEQ